MSVAGFLSSGRVVDFLRSPKKTNPSPKGRGRPLVGMRDVEDYSQDVAAGWHNCDIVCDENNQLFGDTHTAAERLIGRFKNMLRWPVGDDINTDVYVLWEVWVDRGTDDESDYTQEEREHILTGPALKNLCSVVRYIRKVSRVQVNGRQVTELAPNNLRLSFYNSLADYAARKKSYPQVDDEPCDEAIPYYICANDPKWRVGSQRDEFTLNDILGNKVDITTIGLSCGRLFRFPEWMDKLKLARFIQEYNDAAMKIIETRNDVYFSADARNRITRNQRKEQYDDLYKAWFPLWIECIRGRRNMSAWSNTFNLKLLRTNLVSSMSMYTWFGSTTSDEVETEDGREAEPTDTADNDYEIEVSGPNDGYLLPTGKKSLISWAIMEKLFLKAQKAKNQQKADLTNELGNANAQRKREIEAEIAEIDIFFESHKKPEKVETFPVDITHARHPNIYKLILDAQGAQGQEHVNLSSFLGTGVHTEASLTVLRLQNVHRVISTAITKQSALEDYEKEIPGIVRDVGHALITSKLGNVANIADSMIAVEFPVYLLDHPFGGMYLYSRIDAISKGIGRRQEIAVWEYKSKWANDIEIEHDAHIGDIRQAAFYCYCLSQMTTLDPVEHFYIRYVKILREVERPTIRVITHKYAYKLANGRFLFDFDKWVKDVENIEETE